MLRRRTSITIKSDVLPSARKTAPPRLPSAGGRGLTHCIRIEGYLVVMAFRSGRSRPGNNSGDFDPNDAGPIRPKSDAVIVQARQWLARMTTAVGHEQVASRWVLTLQIAATGRHGTFRR